MTKFNVTTIDVRPKQMAASEIYRFLVSLTTDTCESMCYCFQYNMNTDKIMGNVQQFVGIDSLFIGQHALKDPAVLILQENLKTLTVIAFNSQLEDSLPRGNI